MPETPVDVLQARVAILERRLQLVAEEVAVALSQSPAVDVPSGTDGETAQPFPASLKFSADSLSQFSSGFYQTEHDAAGEPFRWTGDGPICEFRFFLDRSEDRAFRMDAGTTDLGVLSELKGFVDYAPIALAVEVENSKHFITGLVPKRLYTRLGVITFLLGKDFAAGLENLWLGFQFYSIDIG